MSQSSFIFYLTDVCVCVCGSVGGVRQLLFHDAANNQYYIGRLNSSLLLFAFKWVYDLVHTHMPQFVFFFAKIQIVCVYNMRKRVVLVLNGIRFFFNQLHCEANTPGCSTPRQTM